jgi:hypothetical protein
MGKEYGYGGGYGEANQKVTKYRFLLFLHQASGAFD